MYTFSTSTVPVLKDWLGDGRNEECTHTHAGLVSHTHTGTQVQNVSVDSMATVKVRERRTED